MMPNSEQYRSKITGDTGLYGFNSENHKQVISRSEKIALNGKALRNAEKCESFFCISTK